MKREEEGQITFVTVKKIIRGDNAPLCSKRFLGNW